MEDNNLEKEEQELTKKDEIIESETEEVTEENVTENEKVKEAVEIEEKAPKVKKEKKTGFFNFLFGNVIDLIAILFLSLIGLVLTGLVLKVLGYYVKENLTLYLLIVPIIWLFYSTIMETKLKATFGKKILGLKLTK